MLFRWSFTICFFRPQLKNSNKIINTIIDGSISSVLFFFLIFLFRLLSLICILYLDVARFYLFWLYHMLQIFTSRCLWFVQILFSAKAVQSLYQRFLCSSTFTICSFVLIRGFSLFLVTTFCNTMESLVAWRIYEVRWCYTLLLSHLLALSPFDSRGIHQLIRCLHVEIKHLFVSLLSIMLKMRLTHEMLITRQRSSLILFSYRHFEFATSLALTSIIWVI